MSNEFKMRKFTDSANAVVVEVIATTEIPVCEKCWKASKPWWLGFAICLGSVFLAGIPFAMAQDKHLAIPKVIPILMLAVIATAIFCGIKAKSSSPVRLIPGKIDQNNLRIKFFNELYADAFLELNKEKAHLVSPWKFG